MIAGLPLRRYSCEMRPLRYSINVTLDGCCDHRAIPADEDLHRHAVENLNQADALLFGRVTYEMMESAWRPPAGVRLGGGGDALPMHLAGRDRYFRRVELENDSGGLWRTVNHVHGIQKIRGSNPLGSTIRSVYRIGPRRGLSAPASEDLTSTFTPY